MFLTISFFGVANCILPECKDDILFFVHVTCNILIPKPGIEPAPPAVGAQSPNHWTTGEFLMTDDILSPCSYSSGGHKSNMVSLGSHQGVWQTVFFLEIQEVNPLPLLVQAPETPTLPGAPPPASANPSGILLSSFFRWSRMSLRIAHCIYMERSAFYKGLPR